MPLSKAIEIIEGIINSKFFTPTWDVVKSLKLGIEALKAWQRIRKGATSQHLWILPGETEE